LLHRLISLPAERLEAGGVAGAPRVAQRAVPVIGRAPSSVRAGVAELVDALDLGSSIERCGGSSPFARTIFARSLSGGQARTKIAAQSLSYF
jgi:hypothetical protein